MADLIWRCGGYETQYQYNADGSLKKVNCPTTGQEVVILGEYTLTLHKKMV